MNKREYVIHWAKSIFCLNSLSIFCDGLLYAKRGLFTVLQILILINLFFGTSLYVLEHEQQPEIFGDWYKSCIWCVLYCLGNPCEFISTRPETMAGQILTVLLTVIRICLLAILTGLALKGFTEAITAAKRKRYISELHDKLIKKFKRVANKELRSILNGISDLKIRNLDVLNFVPRRRLLSDLQIQLGASKEDLIAVAREYPNEFRVHNLASAKSVEESQAAILSMEHFLVNTSYGCCINRDSKVTIVSTSSYNENGTGWWAYYLALFGGFNYVSKELEIDLCDSDSFFNISNEPTCNKKKISECVESAEEINLIEQKAERRSCFINDIKALVNKNGKEKHWIFVVCESIKNSSNDVDFHAVTTDKNNQNSTVAFEELSQYDKLTKSFNAMFNAEYKMKFSANNNRYPLTTNNLLYRIRKEGCTCNGVVLRPSSEMINFNARALVFAFRIAENIGNSLDIKHGVIGPDSNELKKGYGYMKREYTLGGG